jgi:uncharacterized protein (DUF952 family)
MPSGRPAGRIFHLQTGGVPASPPAAGDPPLAADQFQRHGFVHCCFREQLTEIASWWFDPGDHLVALELDAARLSAPLRLEPSPTRWYPHLYGPIDAAAVVGVHAVPAAAGGRRAELPAALRDPLPRYQLTGVVDGSSCTVRWRADGTIEGDATWCERARSAIAGGATIELLGGIVVAATLDGAYESFTLLTGLTDDGAILRYDGDGFF